MKHKIPLVICLLFTASPLHSAEATKEDQTSISVDALNKITVIGKLNIPLGKAVKMEAIIVAEGSLNSKPNRTYNLKVTSVAGKDLREPVTMQFQDPGNGPLRSKLSDLYQMKKGRKAEGMTEEIMTEVERGYVGSKVKFLGFESGSFLGIPEGLDEAWPGESFRFHSTLIIIPE